MSNVVEKLTEGIVNRNVAKEGEALLNKWSNTGLLEGLEGDHERQSMACLLENQAKELLREANSMGAGGAVEGFASVAFPIVRRVFGGLLANDLVSVQPMSLPSGLIFFLDFTHGGTDGTAHDVFTGSLHGGGVTGKEIAGGATDITETGFYALSQGAASPRGRAKTSTDTSNDISILDMDMAGSVTNAMKKALQYDPDVLADVGTDNHYVAVTWNCANEVANHSSYNGSSTDPAESQTGAQQFAQFNQDNVKSFDVSITAGTLIRRLTTAVFDANGACTSITFVVKLTQANVTGGHNTAAAFDSLDCTFEIADKFKAATATGGVAGDNQWAFEDAKMPEIDIKVDSIAITAQTKKLKAKWTPELGQDLNAYHNLDAEVELTSVLSEQIALEIDKEILNDLLQGAANTTRYWSKLPGQKAGADGSLTEIDFTGNVSEWYETLVETINDVSADIHRKTLRGGANFIVCGPEVANVLEFTSGFRASGTHDADRGTVGGYKDGSINKKWDLYVDPYFPRNAVLVGRKGSSFLESGYVYAPYVPLQTTPTVFDPDTLTPRKGVMTRYGKKMVRADMYGVVLVRDM